MSIKRKVIISASVIFIIAAVLFAALLKTIYTPTEGPEIAEYDSPRKAVMVIDVQEDFTGLMGKQPVPLPNAGAQIETINRITEYSSGAGIEVVYIRQVFDDNLISRLLVGRAIEGMPGVALDSRVKVVSDNDFTKRISDAFSNPLLGEFLVRNQVDELYLAGLDAAYCVYYTALGALNRGYRVSVVMDAVMTGKDMREITSLYREHGITMISSEDLLK